MKKLTFLIGGLSIAFSALAQEVINIHRATEATAHVFISELDSISFSNDHANIRFHTKNELNTFPTDEIDSLTFGKAESTIAIHYDGNTATVSNPLAGHGVEVTIEEADVTVTSTIDAEVEYRLTGTTPDGLFKLYGQKKSILTLSGVSLTNADGPAINIQAKKKTTVNLVDGTRNTLMDGTTYTPCGEEDMKGTFFSEGQLVIGGTGTLNIQGHHQHGLCSDDYITINDGNITIEVSADTSKGIKCNDDLTVNNGNITIRTTGNTVVNEGDASYCTAMKTDANLYLYGGNITTTSSGKAGRGMSADGEIIIGEPDTEGPTLHVTTTGESIFISGWGMDADYASPKCIKADGNLTITNSNIYIKSSQDGGEGLESKATLTINGGNIEVETVDDAINAATHLAFNGGRVYCHASNNDAVDSNGTITISGGINIFVGAHVPEGGIDCDNNRFAITGGILVATGGSTAIPTTSACTQCSVTYEASALANKTICIKDAAGNAALIYTMPDLSSAREGNVMLFSTPLLKEGTTYTILTDGSVTNSTPWHGYYSDAIYTGGNTTDTFTTSSIFTNLSGSTSGPGGGGPGFPPGGGGPGSRMGMPW